MSQTMRGACIDGAREVTKAGKSAAVLAPSSAASAVATVASWSIKATAMPPRAKRRAILPPILPKPTSAKEVIVLPRKT